MFQHIFHMIAGAAKDSTFAKTLITKVADQLTVAHLQEVIAFLNGLLAKVDPTLLPAAVAVEAVATTVVNDVQAVEQVASSVQSDPAAASAAAAAGSDGPAADPVPAKAAWRAKKS